MEMFGLHSADIIFHLAWALLLLVIALPAAVIMWTLKRVDPPRATRQPGYAGSS